MADVKLTPRQASRLLMHLDESVRQLTQIRAQIIDAMARRKVKRPAPERVDPRPPRST